MNVHIYCTPCLLISYAIFYCFRKLLNFRVFYTDNIKIITSYNNSRCVYAYIFPVPRIVATALNI